MRINDNDEFEWDVDTGADVALLSGDTRTLLSGLDAVGRTQTGSIVVRDNPFDPKLQEVDISGFTFFRDRDDGNFDDFAEVESFIRTQVKENSDFAQMALRHYINETGIKSLAKASFRPTCLELWTCGLTRREMRSIRTQKLILLQRVTRRDLQKREHLSKAVRIFNLLPLLRLRDLKAAVTGRSWCLPRRHER